MKVAQILYSGLGGHGSVAFTLAEAAGQRWAHSFAFLGVEPLLDSYRQRCDEAGIAHTYFRAMAGRPWGQWRALHRWLERERPDAIINHSGPAIVPCALHSARRGARFVQVEHTAVALKSRSEIIASRMAMALADAVVMLTPDYARLSRERLGRYLPWRKVHIIPNGIDTRRFRPRTGRRPAGPRIGMAGRFTPGKRQELLVRAVAALNAGRGEPTWTLSLAGDGSERAAVAALAERLAPGTVEFAGVLDEEQLGRWFQTLDVYAHASNGETLSTAVLQAMASGVPIVASDVDGIRDLLADASGMLVANDDHEGWRAAIARLGEDDGQARRLAERARQLAEARYSAEDMFRRYDALLRGDGRGRTSER